MEQTLPKIVVGFFIALAIFGIINSISLSKKEKIFTAGIVYEKSGPGKSGTTYFFKYSLGNKEYNGNTTGLLGGTTNKNGLLYIEVLKSDFTAYRVLEFNKVPDCLTIDDAPVNGWTKLPGDTICK